MVGCTLALADPCTLAVWLYVAITDRHGSMAVINACRICAAGPSNVGAVMARPAAGHEETVISLYLGTGTPSKRACALRTARRQAMPPMDRIDLLLRPGAGAMPNVVAECLVRQVVGTKPDPAILRPARPIGCALRRGPCI